jgi:AraC-like DNA-binding protein
MIRNANQLIGAASVITIEKGKLIRILDVNHGQVHSFMRHGIHLEGRLESSETAKLLFVVPVGKIDISVDQPTRFQAIDSTKVVWIPAGKHLWIRPASSVVHFFYLTYNNEWIKDAVKDNSLIKEGIDSLATSSVVDVSKWLGAVRDQYYFERFLNINTPNQCTHYLEKQLINGYIQIRLSTPRIAEEKENSSESFNIDPILRFVEQNLLDHISIDQLTKIGKMSERTLNRRFASATGKPPLRYILERRLEVGQDLLKQGHSAKEVAELLCYSETAAFSRAMKKFSGVSPETFKSVERKKP